MFEGVGVGVVSVGIVFGCVVIWRLGLGGVLVFWEWWGGCGVVGGFRLDVMGV